ncbi:MAG: HAMP domain-containing histidine kinase [Bacteroidetes bacterium]|nr:HAMP domain-containing histidine kinase [Bacteroidota bacterium]
MDIYKKRNYWKRFLLVIGLLIVIFSVNYIRGLAKEIALQEQEKAKIIARAYLDLNGDPDSDELNRILETISGNKLIPVIYTYNTNEVVYHSNFDSARVARNPRYLNKQVKKLKQLDQAIELEFDENEHHYLYYGDSDVLRRVKLYPIFQLGLIGLFMVVSYIAFNASRRAEQNRVWVGMAKETAHQLGTPLSSIAAWLDILREKERDEDDTVILNDMEKDVTRLELVAERFSKIGSPPKLTTQELKPLVHKVVDYIAKRAAAKVSVQLTDQSEGEIRVLMNTALMDWVLENLLKNALDAIDDDGRIDVVIKEKDELAVIEVSDTGKGIPKSKHNTIFEPGFSTKRRGWGLGLTLVKRIVEQYHGGKIFVKQSSPGNGTTFRIELNKA